MKERKLEQLIYTGLWSIAILLYMLDNMRLRWLSAEPLFGMNLLRQGIFTFIPFITLFLVHNNIFIPQFLRRNRYKKYFLFTILLLLAVWLIQWFEFIHMMEHHKFKPQPAEHHPRPLLPMPLLLVLLYDLVIVGFNLAVYLIFRTYNYRLEQERLLKRNAENNLTFLKAQINPHFYMNMLNNIHGMIEIDAAKAQDMVIEMSSLMRYMLYDSQHSSISLNEEIRFMTTYLSLMRQRYPLSKLDISFKFPAKEDSTGVMVPPLLFLVFLENAFKHGVSYRDKSFVSISLEIHSNNISFKCLNSCREEIDEDGRKHGIGLKNVRERLQLIYGDDYNLTTTPSASTYLASLTIPTNKII